MTLALFLDAILIAMILASAAIALENEKQPVDLFDLWSFNMYRNDDLAFINLMVIAYFSRPFLT